MSRVDSSSDWIWDDGDKVDDNLLSFLSPGNPVLWYHVLGVVDGDYGTVAFTSLVGYYRAFCGTEASGV